MGNAGPSGPIHPLDYEPANPRRRRWRLVRRIVLWTLALAVGVMVFMFRTELWLRTRRAYWLYECMHHVTPPGTVLEEDDPAKAAKLLATNPDYVQAISYDAALLKDPSKVPPLPPTAIYCPREFRGLLSTDPQVYIPCPGTAIAFMGELRARQDIGDWLWFRSLTSICKDLNASLTVILGLLSPHRS